MLDKRRFRLQNESSSTGESRIELHEKLSLTGAEISLNELPAGANVPFVHSHKENEEIYGILSGNAIILL